MSEDFKSIIEFTLKHEGGFVDDQDDPGKATNFGISKKYHPNVDVKNLTKEEAIEIYYEEYWEPYCRDLTWPLNALHFDSVVLHGPAVAGQFILLAKNPSDYLMRRVAHTRRTVVDNPKKEKFLKGWISRIADLYNVYLS